jgi:autotransporter-associated beta strand protein
VNAGTLAYGATNALNSAVAVAGGTLALSTFSDTVGAVTLSSGSITGTTGVLTGTSYSLTDSGSVSAILAGTAALTKTGVGTATLTGANTYSGGTTVTSGTLILAHNNAAGTAGIALSGGSSSTLQIASGVTIANNIVFSNTNAGSSVSRLVANAANYTVGTSGNLTSAFAFGQADTTARILAGTNAQGSEATLVMRFSDTSAATNDGVRKSDVFSLSGTSTDLFVLQLNVTGLDSSSFLGWLNGGSWVNAVSGDTGNNASGAQLGYLGSFSAFQGTYGTTLSAYVGAYGVDVSGGSTWAVLNHNSDYAVIPEPSTWVLLAIGLTVVVTLRRRIA